MVFLDILKKIILYLFENFMTYDPLCFNITRKFIKNCLMPPPY